MSSDVIRIGLEGMNRGFASAAKNAQRVVDAFASQNREGESLDTVEPLIDLQQDKRQVQASAKIVKIGDELLETVLNILA